MKYSDFKRMLKVADGNIEDFEAVFNQVEQEAREGYLDKATHSKEVDLLAKQHKLELQGVKQGFKLDSELGKVNTHDQQLLKSLLDMKALKFTDEGIDGLEDQIKSLKEAKPYLFKEEQTEDTPKAPQFNFTGATPATNTGASNTQVSDEQAILNAMLSSSLI